MSKKKVRVAFKKNRQKRTRANDLTRRYKQDDLAKAEPTSGERIRAKGDLSRHRTVMQDVPEQAGDAEAGNDASARLSVDLSACLPGRVIRVHGLITAVETEDRRVFQCNVRRVLKTLAIDGRNVIAVGDHVWFRPGAGGGDEGTIERVEARRGTITRGYRRREHVLVAQRRPAAHHLGPRRAGPEAPADRPLPDLGRDRGGPPDHRPEQGRPRRPRPLPVGRGPVCAARLRDDRHVGGRRPGDRPAPGPAGQRHDGLLGAERRRQELAPERDPARPEPPRPRGLRLDRQGEAHDHHRRADPPGGRRLRHRHPRPPPVRALGRRARRGRRPLRRIPALPPPLQVPRLLAHPRGRMRRQGRRPLGPDPRRPL